MIERIEIDEKHPDRDSYEIVWDRVIKKEINNYKKIYGDYIVVIPNIKEEIWNKYIKLNTYCKNNYMKNPKEKIDRHKVAACYLIAIVMVHPLIFIGSSQEEIALNEPLAITIALSLVRAFAIAALKEKEEKKLCSKEEINTLLAKFQKGVKLPEGALVNHGDYLDNFANEIHFSFLEGKICILSLAHELYLLETITKLS